MAQAVSAPDDGKKAVQWDAAAMSWIVAPTEEAKE
jgi:hypothetical protein